MLTPITKDTLHVIKDLSFRRYAQMFTRVEENTLANIESFGVPLGKQMNQKEKELILTRIREKEAVFRNNDKSIYVNRISSACEACKTGEGSYTTFISLKCHRNCYFCFNKNQEDYAQFSVGKKNVEQELLDLLEAGHEFSHLALTGGEPLLFKEDTVRFFQLAKEKTPRTYTRLYTAGDLLDQETLFQLKETELDEIRFSIKMEDSSQKQTHILKKIEMAQQFIPNVLVEMPVIPGTMDNMKELLLKLDDLGIYGINLLEFCFPLENVQPFIERGFSLKNPPYEKYYNYWYAGGLAVADSEAMCLELVEFALDQQLKLGVHYCSLENKHTGQIYQQNRNQHIDETYMFSTRDHFFKTAKVFGKDKKKVIPVLREHRIPFEIDELHDLVQFPVKSIELLKDKRVEVGIVSSVVEWQLGERLIREVSIDWTKPNLFRLEDHG